MVYMGRMHPDKRQPGSRTETKAVPSSSVQHRHACIPAWQIFEISQQNHSNACSHCRSPTVVARLSRLVHPRCSSPSPDVVAKDGPPESSGKPANHGRAPAGRGGPPPGGRGQGVGGALHRQAARHAAHPGQPPAGVHQAGPAQGPHGLGGGVRGGVGEGVGRGVEAEPQTNV